MLKALLDEVGGPAQPLELNNDLPWGGALMAMIGRIAVVAQDPAEGATVARQRELADNA